MKILVVTACGGKQETSPCPAHRLYKSPRIKAVYKRKGDCDFCILSGKYGLLEPDRVIRPYNDVMTPEGAQRLLPQVVHMVKNYDTIIYFKAGARAAYLDCIKTACKTAGKTLITTGFAHMGAINNIPKIINFAKEGKLEEIEKLPHTKVIT
ncbi:MAG: hypothetical protein AOA65_2134 [Candidatus Bathyarchaeota archaeon BA1]|nr:MAG: hypothetical protein AOA65_2134 [Candidatus Bathyarchaeota archaeon BA1]